MICVSSEQSASTLHNFPNAPPPHRLALAPDTVLHTRQSPSCVQEIDAFTLHFEPLSHCSPWSFWIILSPQISALHVLLQPSLSALLPSSHCSPGSTVLSPHKAHIQFLHVAPPVQLRPGSPHSSPSSKILLPHALADDELLDRERELELLLPMGTQRMHGRASILTQSLGPSGSVAQNRTPSGPGTPSLSSVHAFGFPLASTGHVVGGLLDTELLILETLLKRLLDDDRGGGDGEGDGEGDGDGAGPEPPPCPPPCPAFAPPLFPPPAFCPPPATCPPPPGNPPPICCCWGGIASGGICMGTGVWQV